MDCTRASDLMMGYFDRVLNDFEKDKLFLHIKSCSICREEFNAIEEAITGIRQLDDFMVPDFFEAEVMNAIDIKKYAKESKKSKYAVFFHFGILALLAMLSAGVYLRFGSVHVKEAYSYVTSITQWVSVTTMVNTISRMISTIAIVWVQLLKNMPFHYKGLIGAYFGILYFLCAFFIGIQLILMKLTTGEITRGGSIHEE